MSDAAEYFLREFAANPHVRSCDPRHVAWALAKIERLKVALSDVLPLAERYVGRSDGVQDAIYDKIANARRALGREDKG